MVDLCLVNPNNRVPAPFSSLEPPLWLGLIAGYNLEQGKSVAIVDAEAEGLTTGETIKRVEDLQPKNTLIVVMGTNPSCSSTPKMSVTEELQRHINIETTQITGIHPIALNCAYTIIKPFEGFPFIPWDLLPMSKYKAHNWHCLNDIDNRTPYGVLYTSLNCPFECQFCNIHTLYGDRKVRYRSLGDIYKDLDYFAENNIKNIKIWDELFCLDKDRAEKICDYISHSCYDFNIWAYARVDTVDQALLEKMKRAGISWLAYGFESADGDIRKQSGKKFSNSTAKRAIDMTRDAGINIIANFIFGLPGDTLDGMRANLEMAMRENFEYVNFSIGLPYPGSEWYSKEKVKTMVWSSYSQFANNICASPEVVKFRDEAFNTYFSRPEYQSSIRVKFGERAEEHIKQMLSWNIRG